ncbi:MAG: mechanosensitive ion channel domain-containing protein [Bacteroidota bacterium]
MDTSQIENYVGILQELAIKYGTQLIGAVIVLIIGLWIAGALTKAIARTMERRNVDASLRPFLKSLISTLLKVLVIISAAGMVGIEMTSFVAILGAAGLAVGLALSGTLQNFAGGVMILIFRPYKVGDFIDAQGYMGVVKEIQIFVTVLKTPDNKTIIIPNGPMSTGSLTNFSTEPQRRVDWTFGIGYGDSTEKAKEVLMELINADERILKDPEPFIAVSELADSSVNLVVRVWAEAGDYWGIYFDMNEKVYNKFNEVGLNIPFPQMDVHVHK